MADNVESTVNTAGLAPYAMPYVADLFGRTAAVGAQPYTPYTGERVAQFSDLQNQAYLAAAGLAPSDYLDYGATVSKNIIDRAAEQLDYDPASITASQVSAPSLGAAPTFAGATLGAAPTASGATLGAAPTASAVGFSGPASVSSQSVNAPAVRQYQMQAATTNFDPTRGLQQYQMGPAERVGTERFIDPTNAQDYMSPYMRQVIEIQKREAQRQGDIESTQRAAQAARAGAAGGTREAIMAAEAARNLATQLGDIEATGMQSAYTNAQQQFNADQARALTAAQANQGAGLTVGGQNLQALLGVQGLGANLGTNVALANLANQQAANQANLQANLGTQQLGVTSSLQAQQANQSAGLQAALANQQMQYNTAQQNAAMQNAASLANAQMAGQYGLTGAQLQQQVALANQALAGQYGLAQAGYAQQAGLANQQLAGQYGLTGAQLGLQAGIANQNAGLTAQQLSEQSRQFGSNLGLSALNTGLNAATQLGNLGTTQFNQAMGAANLQNTFGTQQQGQAQNVLNQQYQDFLTQQQYPQQMLNFQKGIYSGFPMGSSTTQNQLADPSLLSQLAGGVGTAAMVGKYFNEGGAVKSPRSAGLADLMIAKLNKD